MNETNNIINNIFFVATKKKLRIDSGRGSLAAEDLFDLSLAKLDDIAVGLDEAIQKLGRKSFISQTVRDSNDTQLKFDIVLAIIEFKKAENSAARAKADKENQRAFLKELLAKKEIAAMEGQTVEELKKQLEALEA